MFSSYYYYYFCYLAFTILINYSNKRLRVKNSVSHLEKKVTAWNFEYRFRVMILSFCFFKYFPGRPVVYPPESSLIINSGQQVDFHVEYCANPPTTRAFWVTETQRLVPGQIKGSIIAKNITVK